MSLLTLRRCGLVVGSLLLLNWGPLGEAAITAPTDIAGLQLWLDGTDAATITQSSGIVSQWNDKSGNARNFSQATVGAQPFFYTDNVTTSGAIRFSGTNQTLNNIGGTQPLAAGDDTFNYFIVWKPHTQTGGQAIYDQGGLNNIQHARAALFTDPAAYGFVGQGNDIRNVPYQAGNWVVTSMAIDAGAAAGMTVVHNNGTPITGANPTAALNVSSLLTRVAASSRPTANEFFNGDIAEIVVYNSVLSASERNDVINYLAEKHSLLSNANTGLDSIRHRWSFTTGANQQQDSVGTAHITSINGTPTFSGDKVTLDGTDWMRTAGLDSTIGKRTIVAWLTNTDLNQAGGGGVMTLEKGTDFDGIVWDEINPANNNWMNGIGFHNRSRDGGATETSTSEIMLAIVYDVDNSIEIYRDGVLYDSYTQGTFQQYLSENSTALFGLRHIGASPTFQGILNEARIYGDTLTPEQILQLFELGPDLLAEPMAVPEPASMVVWSLLALMLGAIGWRRRR